MTANVYGEIRWSGTVRNTTTNTWNGQSDTTADIAVREGGWRQEKTPDGFRPAFSLCREISLLGLELATQPHVLDRQLADNPLKLGNRRG